MKKLIIHLIVWLLFIFAFWILSGKMGKSYFEFVYTNVVGLWMPIAYFYLYYYSINKLVNRVKKPLIYAVIGSLIYIFAMSILIEIAYITKDWIFYNIGWLDTPNYSFIFSEIFLTAFFIFLMTMGALLYFFIHNIVFKNKQIKALELSNLKSQVNPHFFNNELSRIYSKVYHGEIEQSLLYIKTLSEHMTHTISSFDKPLVFLREELNFTLNYLDHIHDQTTGQERISYKVQGKALEYKIQPLVLINFIENSVKYSDIINLTSANINLKINIDKTHLTFELENSIAQNSSETEKMSTQKGEENILKRLELFYDDRFEYHVDMSINMHKIYLKIPLI